MRGEEIFLGPVPALENCAQVGDPGYSEKARAECKAYLNQLKRKFGEPPMGGSLKMISCPHDFGEYYEVVAFYDERFPDSAEWAFDVEDNLPELWDDEARVELTFLNLKFP